MAQPPSKAVCRYIRRALCLLLAFSALLPLCACGGTRVRLDLAGEVSAAQSATAASAAASEAAESLPSSPARDWRSAYAQAAQAFYIDGSYASAYALLDGAENSDSAKAMFLLGICRWYGFGCALDRSAAYPLFAAAAECGYVPALYMAAEAYSRGFPAETDCSHAQELYSRFVSSAAEYDGSALETGVVCYFACRCAMLGLGTARDVQAAAAYAEKALDSGLAGAVFCYDLAADIEAGRLGEPDTERSQALFTALLPRVKTLAEGGCPSAQRQYALYFLNGECGVEKSPETALKWLKSAADQGEPDALRLCGTLYRDTPGIEPDFDLAMEYYTAAAAVGSAAAKADIGYMYHNGLGVKRDFKKAAEWYAAAIMQGNDPTCTIAYNNLGYLYQYGLGVEADPEKAVDCYRKAADFGEAEGYFNLGWCYEHGCAVAQDIDEAVRFYSASARRGSEQAALELARLAA